MSAWTCRQREKLGADDRARLGFDGDPADPVGVVDYEGEEIFPTSMGRHHGSATYPRSIQQHLFADVKSTEDYIALTPCEGKGRRRTRKPAQPHKPRVKQFWAALAGLKIRPYFL